jgi:hypothetical protein
VYKASRHGHPKQAREGGALDFKGYLKWFKIIEDLI